MQCRRVVVTGIGVVSPLAGDAEGTWRCLLAGQSGISVLPDIEEGDPAVRLVGSVRDFEPAPYLSPKHIRVLDPFMQYGIVAGLQAVNDAGLKPDADNAHRVGVIIGSGMGGIANIEKAVRGRYEHGVSRVSPFFIPSVIANMIAGNLSIEIGAKAMNYGVVSACATGSHSIGAAVDAIRLNRVDAVVAGGAEMVASSWLARAGFSAARALSTRNDDPERASRPWDQDRDGFVMGDGAGAMVLEEYEFARSRGARILAELIGYGNSSDAYHMTAPSVDGEGAISCMQNALLDAGIQAQEVDYINAHSTSTVAGDVVEVKAIKQVFGSHASRLAISSTKSMVGHMLGAAGAVEAIFCVQALRDQTVPPTINLDRPDTDCDLDFVPHKSRSLKLDTTLSNSFGFGGTNCTLIFRRMEHAADPGKPDQR